MKVASVLESWEPSGHTDTFPQRPGGSWGSLEFSGACSLLWAGRAFPSLGAGPAPQEFSASLSSCPERLWADGWAFVPLSLPCRCKGSGTPGSPWKARSRCVSQESSQQAAPVSDVPAHREQAGVCLQQWRVRCALHSLHFHLAPPVPCALPSK